MDVPTTVPLSIRQQILSEPGDRFSADKNDLRDIIYLNFQNILTKLWDFHGNQAQNKKESPNMGRNKGEFS